MCRAAIEESLDKKRVKGKDLFEKIENAKGTYLGDGEVAIATGARLIGRDALHHGLEVTLTQAAVMLSATAEVVNHIAQQP